MTINIAVSGGKGRVGVALGLELAAWTGFSVSSWDRSDLDLSRPEELHPILQRRCFNVLINATGFTAVDACEAGEAEAIRINGEAVGIMAAVCREKGARFIHFSSDYVFDGTKAGGYMEDDAMNPLSAYGRSKRLGEELALAANPECLIIRTSWLFGPHKPSFPDWVLRQAQSGAPLKVVADKRGCPTYTTDLAKWLALLVMRYPDQKGILHLANSDSCTWHEYASFILQSVGGTATAEPVASSEIPSLVAQRPAISTLLTRRFQDLTGLVPRPWHDAVAAYLHDAAKA